MIALLLFSTLLSASEPTIVHINDVISNAVKGPSEECEADPIDNHIPLACSDKTNIPLFQEEKPIKFKMKSDYFDNRISDDDQSYTSSFEIDGSPFSGTITNRGQFRKMTCHQKPFLISIDKKNKKQDTTISHLNDEFKIVRPCKRAEEDPEAASKVLREYQQYKLLECLGLPHFKVRLYEGEYLKSTGEVSQKSMGFVIEPAHDLSQRCGSDAEFLKKEEVRKLAVAKTLPQSMGANFLLHFSEAILGNTDYTASGTHNSKMISKNNQLLNVPYDFDLSWLTEDPNMLMMMDDSIIQRSLDLSLKDAKVTSDPGIEKAVICPTIKMVESNFHRCEKSIQSGPLSKSDKDLFLQWNLTVNQLAKSYLKKKKDTCQ
jgi:hypothetical protein